jgi:hypothetical protein
VPSYVEYRRTVIHLVLNDHADRFQNQCMLVNVMPKRLRQSVKTFQLANESLLPQPSATFEVVQRLAVTSIGLRQHLLVVLA